MLDVQRSLAASVRALQLGDVDAALRMASETVRAHPGLAAAHLVLGRARLAVHRTEEAVSSLRAALRLDADSAEIHASLATALAAKGLVREPLEHFVRAIELAPQEPEVRVRAGHFLLAQGHLDEAFELYLAAADQDSPAGLAGLIAVLERRGENHQAIALVDENPDAVEASDAVALAAARLWHRAGRGEEARRALERVISRSPSPVVRVPVLHLLGEVYEKEARFDDAFAAWRDANELRGLRFDATALRARIDRLIAETSPAELKKLPKASSGSELPIFVVGMPRSGTSLAEQILDRHPRAAGAGELELLGEIAARLDRGSRASVEQASRDALATLSRHDPTAKRIVDKMPHDWLHLGVVAQILPGARVIHCVRDPLDNCLSCYAKNFAASHDYATDLGSLGDFYREQERLMAHWKSVLPLRFFTLSYEALVLEPEPVLRRLLEFCDLEWHPDVLSFHESKRTIATASYDQVRQPLYATSVGRASRFAGQLGALEAALA